MSRVRIRHFKKRFLTIICLLFFYQDNSGVIDLEWIMEAICEEIDRDPKQVFLIDVVPNLRFLLRCGAITADPEYELKKFTQKVSLAHSALDHIKMHSDTIILD